MSSIWWHGVWTAPLVLGLVVGVLQASDATVAVKAPNLPGYKLMWSDEFNYTGLPDPKKWGYEEGWVRNHELQYYTRDRKENARVENGMLIIEGRKEQFKNPNYDPAHPGTTPEYAAYTSASLTTQGMESWKYGRIEVRAKLPHGLGVWPAIWMLGDDISKVGWPACGETDIMEFVGHSPKQVHATVHYRIDGKHQSNGKALDVDKPWDGFHVYAVDWTPERMDFYYDNTKYQSFNVADARDAGQNPFQKPQFLILNLALGGSWGGKMDDSILPQKFEIDYVRVYQKTPAQ